MVAHFHSLLEIRAFADRLWPVAKDLTQGKFILSGFEQVIRSQTNGIRKWNSELRIDGQN